MAKQSFTDKLSEVTSSGRLKTFGDMESIFAEKSFAVAFLILMIAAAMPLPTGGITHVFEIITMLLAAEMVWGRRTLWLPKRWRGLPIGQRVRTMLMPKFIKLIRWFEHYSHPRMSWMANNRWFLRIVGIAVFILALAAFLSPPFTGLDTMPAMGVCLISLALLLEDILMLAAGLAIGISGIVVQLLLGSVIIRLFN